MFLAKMWEPKTLVFMPPREYVPVSQTLIISKYSNVNPHFKGNFILNHNQVVKSGKNQYFDCFNIFSQVQAQK